jgi:hypothetical protein
MSEILNEGDSMDARSSQNTSNAQSGTLPKQSVRQAVRRVLCSLGSTMGNRLIRITGWPLRALPMRK